MANLKSIVEAELDPNLSADAILAQLKQKAQTFEELKQLIGQKNAALLNDPAVVKYLQKMKLEDEGTVKTATALSQKEKQNKIQQQQQQQQQQQTQQTAVGAQQQQQVAGGVKPSTMPRPQQTPNANGNVGAGQVRTAG